jgi:hypothetical protein
MDFGLLPINATPRRRIPLPIGVVQYLSLTSIEGPCAGGST